LNTKYNGIIDRQLPVFEAVQFQTSFLLVDMSINAIGS